MSDEVNEVTQADIDAVADIFEAMRQKPAAWAVRSAGLCGTIHWDVAKVVARLRTAASQASAGEWVQKPRPYPHAQRGDGLKYQETLGFEGGSITIRTTNNGDKDGTGWFCFGEDGQRLEYDEEWGNYFHIVDVPNSELIAIRDKLNEIFPLTTPVEASQPVGDAGEAMSKRTFLTCVSGDGPQPYLKVHFNNLADAHAAHDELLGRKGES